jgi:hypothetical protein
MSFVDAFRHYARAPMIREAVERAIEEMPADAIAVPDDPQNPLGKRP